VKIDLLAKFAW